MVVAASEDFANLQDDRHSNWCQQQVEEEQDRVVGFGRARPIADPAGHPEHLADTLVGARPAAEALQAGPAGHW